MSEIAQFGGHCERRGCLDNRDELLSLRKKVTDAESRVATADRMLTEQDEEIQSLEARKAELEADLSEVESDAIKRCASVAFKAVLELKTRDGEPLCDTGQAYAVKNKIQAQLKGTETCGETAEVAHGMACCGLPTGHDGLHDGMNGYTWRGR